MPVKLLTVWSARLRFCLVATLGNLRSGFSVILKKPSKLLVLTTAMSAFFLLQLLIMHSIKWATILLLMSLPPIILLPIMVLKFLNEVIPLAVLRRLCRAASVLKVPVQPQAVKIFPPVLKNIHMVLN